MLTIETKELNISEELRKKVDMICKFAYVKPTYKKLIPDPLTKDIIVRIYDLYLEEKSYQSIANIYNEEKVLGKTNWRDSTINHII